MNKNSPWYHFHRNSLGWLHRRHARGERICAADVRRLLEADPAARQDEVFREYLERAQRGELQRKRGPQPTSGRQMRLLYAAVLVEDLAARLTARRRRQKSKGIPKFPSQYSATDLALLVTARRLRFGCPETLRNRLSLRRRQLRANSVSAQVALP